MNIIDKQRETVIKENNTAQNIFSGLLENMNKRSTTLDIQEPLHGDLDLSVIKNMGFSFVHTILFHEGEITSIENIPEGITHFTCAHNFLNNLEKLPTSLMNLDIDSNYLESIDLSPCKLLTSARISNNRLKKLEDLPNELIELFVNHNELVLIKLSGLTHLKTLNVSNNKIAIIEDLPENIVDFNMENNPSIQFVNSPVVPMKRKEDAIEQELSYIESLNSYFLMKNNYENTVHEMKRKVFKAAPNKKIGKKRLLEIRPKCIHCARPVGTVFSTKDNRYRAICGDTANPCSLNVELYKGEFSTLTDLIYSFRDISESVKEEIIELKMDTLFEYISEQTSVPLFKDALNEYNTNSRIYERLLGEYSENHFGDGKRDLIEKKRNRIFLYKEQIGDLLKEYGTTQNRELLKTAMNLQVNQLLPETRNLRLLMNEHMEITEKKHTNGKIEYHLFQHPVAFTKLDHNIDEPPRVIKFAK
jgi:hypothetical protein